MKIRNSRNWRSHKGLRAIYWWGLEIWQSLLRKFLCFHFVLGSEILNVLKCFKLCKNQILLHKLQDRAPKTAANPKHQAWPTFSTYTLTNYAILLSKLSRKWTKTLKHTLSPFKPSHRTTTNSSSKIAFTILSTFRAC